MYSKTYILQKKTELHTMFQSKVGAEVLEKVILQIPTIGSNLKSLELYQRRVIRNHRFYVAAFESNSQNFFDFQSKRF